MVELSHLYHGNWGTTFSLCTMPLRCQKLRGRVQTDFIDFIGILLSTLEEMKGPTDFSRFWTQHFISSELCILSNAVMILPSCCSLRKSYQYVTNLMENFIKVTGHDARKLRRRWSDRIDGRGCKSCQIRQV